MLQRGCQVITNDARVQVVVLDYKELCFVGQGLVIGRCRLTQGGTGGRRWPGVMRKGLFLHGQWQCQAIMAYNRIQEPRQARCALTVVIPFSLSPRRVLFRR